MSEYKGIKCPNPECPSKAGEFKTGQMKKTKDVLTRPHTCKVCGTVFETIQVPTGKAEIKNEHLAAAPSETMPVTNPPETPTEIKPNPYANIPVVTVSGQQVKLFMDEDGVTIWAVREDFVDMWTCNYGYGTTQEQAVAQLVAREAAAAQPGNQATTNTC
jgi:hypothetical protein